MCTNVKKIPAIEGGHPIRNEFLIFGSPLIGEEEIKEVVDTLRSGWIGTGPKTQRFEEAFRKYIGAKHALALSSCTAALHLALDVLDIGERDEVITTPMTFAATVNAIIHRRAIPVFADVEKETFNIDPANIEQKITPRTKAIIPVHMAGRPCKMNQIMDIAHRYNLFVIEDAAHAIEAWFQNQKIGTIGNLTAFSFYVTKNLVTGEGGMLTTNNDHWAEQISIKRLHGISQHAWKRYTTEDYIFYETLCPGYKYNMTDIQASLGIHQLAHLEENLKVRERHWQTYNKAFLNYPELILPTEEKEIGHSRHLYTILICPEMLRIDRNTLVKALKAEGIGTGIHFISLHLHPYYRKTYGFKRGDFPNAEFISERTISLPLSAKLTDKDVQDVIDAVIGLIKYYR